MTEKSAETNNKDGHQKQSRISSFPMREGSTPPFPALVEGPAPKTVSEQKPPVSRPQLPAAPPDELAIEMLGMTVEAKWWQKLSLQNKAIICAIVLSIIPVAIIGTIGYYASDKLTGVIIGTSLSVVIESGIALFLAKCVIRPIQVAAAAVKQLEQGKLDTRIYLESKDELAILGNNINQLADRLQTLLTEKEAILRRDRLLSNIAWRARQAQDPQELSNKILASTRRVLNVERVVIYRFNPNYSGTIVAESVAPGWTKAIDEQIEDPCFREKYIHEYENGRVRAIKDVYNDPELNDCHIRLLEQFEVKANLVAPMKKDSQLVGLLIAHQCSGPRNWQQSEIDFFLQLASQIQYALDHVGFIQQLQVAAKRERLLSDIAWRARQNTDPQEIMNAALSGIRKLLEVERVVIYRFHPDWSGTIVAESVAAGWTRVLDEQIEDSCFRENYVQKYQNGRVRAINDVYNDPEVTDCHVRLLEQFEVKANLIAPMKKDDRLVGLLVAHQCSQPRNWQQSEIDFFAQLASQIEYALDHVGFIQQLQAAPKRERLLSEVALKARQTTDPQEVMNAAVSGIRRVLDVERVIIFRFKSDWSGTVVAESVAAGWTKAIDEQIDDPCFRESYMQLYQNGRVRAINDIYNEPSLSECHIRTLEQYEVKANLIAPMKKDSQLAGLLIAHQCSGARNWQQSEIDFFLQVATQIEYALDHVSFIKQLDVARSAAEAVSLEQRQQKEALQAQLEGFLQQIQGAFRGDLTVRAGVTPGEIGTVADFFNALIENLQQIVVKVQSAADAVAQTAKMSEMGVKRLSDEARRQSEAIAATLAQIQAMGDSIQSVASSAKQAESKVREANQTLKAGDEAMNKTVDGIFAIEQTFEETALKVKRLGESSQKISRASSLIKDLANQTNILALNASIEAAGVGKEGQGFAIVAEEVRALAEQSAAATKEIEQIVEEIQIETNEVVTAMEAGMEQVSTGSNLVRTTRAELTSIAAVSGKIRTLVEDMAQAATSQRETSLALGQTMQEVATIANQTAEQSQAVADSFTKLLGVANELQQSVAQFKIK